MGFLKIRFFDILLHKAQLWKILRVSNMKKSKSTDFLKNAGIGLIFDFKHDLKGLKF